jgi:hypothetical protein
VIKGTELTDVQLQLEPVVTLTLPRPPVEGTEADVGAAL